MIVVSMLLSAYVLWLCGSRRQQNQVWRQISWRGVVGTGRTFTGCLRGGCTPPPRPFAQGHPLLSQNIEGCKKFCNAFLQSGFTDLDEIWHDGGL